MGGGRAPKGVASLECDAGVGRKLSFSAYLSSRNMLNPRIWPWAMDIAL